MGHGLHGYVSHKQRVCGGSPLSSHNSVTTFSHTAIRAVAVREDAMSINCADVCNAAPEYLEMFVG